MVYCQLFDNIFFLTTPLKFTLKIIFLCGIKLSPSLALLGSTERIDRNESRLKAIPLNSCDVKCKLCYTIGFVIYSISLTKNEKLITKEAPRSFIFLAG